MTKTSNKLLALATGIALSIPLSTSSFAATATLPAQAVFLTAITLSAPVTMDFGNVAFASATLGLNVLGTDTVTLGTDAVRAFTGTFSGSTAVAGVAGGINITAGSAAVNVTISCSTSGVMKNAGGAGETINVIAVEWVKGAPVTGVATGTGTLCLGTASPNPAFALNGLGTDQLLFGATIDGNGATNPFVAGTYSTATAGGTGITVNINYI